MTDDCRIYLCPNDETVFCVVSQEDYEWASRWKWQYTWDKHRRKRYATRSTTERNSPNPPRRYKLYMHKQILVERKCEFPPTPKHTIGDHQDGDSLNNRRGNLEWATPKQNALNRRKPANDNQPIAEAA